MRSRRLLRQMAGLARSPAEKRDVREKRRALRAQAEQEARMLMVDQVRRREAGESGLKAMPGMPADEMLRRAEAAKVEKELP
jgi:hypothetical protein